MQPLELDGTEWEAYSCCKIIPTGVIYVQGYDDFVPMGEVVVADRMKHEVYPWYKVREHEERNSENIFTPRIREEQE